ncbi:MAG TPA: low molecular weight protein arginine phosphatase [bacterium]|nr:low molecular weight protein arginine phosphatase [bacterium]
MKPTFSVLFVCSGNTCRSPMAEAILKAELAAGRRAAEFAGVRVVSAGLDVIPGDKVSREAVRAVKLLGLTMARRGARRLADDRVSSADLVLTMTPSQRERIIAQWPGAEEKTFVLSEFSGSDRGGIEDPLGGSDRVYSDCARRLASEIKRLLPRLSRRLRERRAHR